MLVGELVSLIWVRLLSSDDEIEVLEIAKLLEN